MEEENTIQISEHTPLLCPACKKADLRPELESLIDVNRSIHARCPECDNHIYLNLIAFPSDAKLEFPVTIESSSLGYDIQQVRGKIGKQRDAIAKLVKENSELRRENEKCKTVESSPVVEETVDMCVVERVDSNRPPGTVDSGSVSWKNRTEESEVEEGWFKGQPVCPTCNNVYVQEGATEASTLCSCDCYEDDENNATTWFGSSEWIDKVASKTLCKKCGKLPGRWEDCFGCKSEKCVVYVNNLHGHLVYSAKEWIKENQVCNINQNNFLNKEEETTQKVQTPFGNCSPAAFATFVKQVVQKAKELHIDLPNWEKKENA